MDFLKRTWAEIDLSAALSNFRIIKKHAAERQVFAVVKADAYGHGVRELSRLYADNGVDAFAVSNIEEALEIRENGISLPLLILGYTPPKYADILVENDISQAVFDLDYAALLNAACHSHLKIHLKLDTGMGRIGFNFRNDAAFKKSLLEIEQVKNLNSLSIEGAFMHFATADFDHDENGEFAESQYRLFRQALEQFKAMGICPPVIHCCNSAAIFLQPENRGNFVRPGIVLYGLNPSAGLDLKDKLQPILSLKTVVSAIKEIETNESVSYGRTFFATRPTKVATIPVGYGDGYPRHLSGCGRVFLNGFYAPIIGRVCMDQTMLDITDIKNVAVGDSVELIGNHVTADEIAELCGTINYEIICGINKRVPRIYINETRTKK